MDVFPLPKVLPSNENKGPALVDTAWVFWIASTVVTVGRLYSKIVKLKRFALDDGLMLLAWAGALIYTAALQTGYHYGMGRHWEYLTERLILSVLKWTYVAQAFTLISPMFGRISFCFYLLSMIGKARHVLRYPLYVFIILQVVFNFTLLITLYAVCGTDLTVIGNPALTCYKPSPWANFSFFVGAVNVFTDAFLTVAPSLMVWKLRTHLNVKIAACVLLSLSVLALGAAIWRTVEIEVLFSDDVDFAHDVAAYFIASTVEMNIVIIATSIPTLGPIFKRKRSQGSSTDSSGRHLSGDSGEIQYNMGKALGMHMPKLGNSVTITAGPLARGHSDEDILPLSPMKPQAIKRVMHTDVSVQYADGRDEEMMESLSPVRNMLKF